MKQATSFIYYFILVAMIAGIIGCKKDDPTSTPPLQPPRAPETAMALTVQAGARFVRFGGYGFIAVVTADDRNYPARAMAAGAWLVVDPQLVAACLDPFGTKARQS